MNAFVPSPSFPPNPKVGQVFNNWVWNGSAWVCTGGGPVCIIKVFLGGGTYWPSPGLTFAIVECIGGGGGGGGVSITQAFVGQGGGGGGSGGYSKSVLAASLLTSGVQVLTGASGEVLTGNNGSPGGTTSFGAFVTALGGAGGGVGIVGVEVGLGGEGAGFGVGDQTFPGNAGTIGDSFIFETGGPAVFATAGMGGLGWGQGSSPQQQVYYTTTPFKEDGNKAYGYGTGGNGGTANSGSTTQSPAITAAGGIGGGGIAIVTEYCFGNTSTVQDCGCGPVSDPCNPCPPGQGGWWTPSW